MIFLNINMAMLFKNKAKWKKQQSNKNHAIFNEF